MKTILSLFASILLISLSGGWGQNEVLAKEMNPTGSAANKAVRVQINQSPIERLLRTVERFYLEAEDPTDVRAQAARLGYHRGRILRFVRDEIAFEPYSGLLRGASGTLFAGSGNSLDQSLLLRELLEASGEQTRIVYKELPPEATARLRERFLKQDVFARLAEREKRGAEVAQQLGADPNAFEILIKEREREETAWVEEILDGADREAARLRKLLNEEISPRPLEIPREHYWVQVLDKEWTDLDPTGVKFDSADARVVNERDLASARSTVAFKLILERDVDGKNENVALLDVWFPIELVAWRPIHFNIQPAPEYFPDLREFTAMNEKERLGVLKKAKVFQAGMLVDCCPYGSAPFDLDGRTYEISADGRVGPAKELGEAQRGVFGAFGGRGGKEPPTRLKGMILEVAISQPGTSARVHRRSLFDGKSGAMPMIGASLLIDTSVPPDGEVERRTLGSVWRHRDELRSVLKGELDGVRVTTDCSFSSLLLRFADLRRRVMALLLKEGNGNLKFFRDRPGMIMEVRQLHRDGQDNIRLRHSIDIMENTVTFVSSSGSFVPQATLRLGIADTALEPLLLVRSDPADSVASAWTILERERLLGGAEQKREVEGKLEIAWGPGAWWSIDLSTGSCVGRVRSGAGQAMVEYALQVADKICTLSVFLSLYAASGHGGQATSDKDQVMGYLCSIVSGTWPRSIIVENKMSELREHLWKISTDALAGITIK